MVHHLSAGYAQHIITPGLDHPVFLAGFDANRRAECVHDDLWVRTLALACGETRLVLACVDVIGLGRHHCLAIQQQLQQQWPTAALIVACTHTHHGPDTIGLWGPDQTRSGVDPHYLNDLQQAVVTCAQQALQSVTPVTMRTATVDVPDVVKNFRDPAILDAELTCIQWVDAADKVFATLLIYPCHPEAMWRDNTAITSDYADALRRTIEAATGAPALFGVGALGGMLSPDVPERNFAATEAMGKLLGNAALGALADKAAHPVTGLTVAQRQFTIPMTNPLFQMAVANGLLPNTFQPDDTVLTEANLLRLQSPGGDLLLATVPGELLPKLGLAYKAQMRATGAATAAIIGLANDELGYILPAEDFIYPENPLEPGEHYEETMSVSREAGPCLLAALTELLAQLYPSRRAA
ncbi:MAG: hypothetical protein DYG89_24250 [Caldilinea sp. CFX5]|nr:hypothetical protein [Caldilinea sp. CFX5]